MMLSYVTSYNTHVLQAFILLRVSVKYFKDLDFSYFLEMLKEKGKLKRKSCNLFKMAQGYYKE